MSSPTRIVALAILERNGRFLMQLRDDIPSIHYPGVWGLFGGHLEPGESPEEALKRELWEEIHYRPATVRKFRCYDGENVNRHIFHVPLTVETSELIQSEGQDLALLGPIDIRAGFYYSERIGETRVLGKIHRQVLLDFMEVTV
ncbi:NUDIX hydrolase [Pannus brasiliensis CCIBt3594]|uniref:NUDIX hydrolase n=1 Tax=Pannus brasiliensis CCIBt3594 TaxID=1427578 RepID=A0AAW9QYL1_9CHRO